MKFLTARVVLQMVIPVKRVKGGDEDVEDAAAEKALRDALQSPDLLPGVSVRDVDVEITGDHEPDPT